MLRRYADALPIRFDRDRLTVADRRYAGAEVGTAFVYPSDRAQRTIVAYTERGEAYWTGRQLAVLGEAGAIRDLIRGDLPAVERDDAPASRVRTFDLSETYVVTEQYYS